MEATYFRWLVGLLLTPWVEALGWYKSYKIRWLGSNLYKSRDMVSSDSSMGHLHVNAMSLWTLILQQKPPQFHFTILDKIKTLHTPICNAPKNISLNYCTDGELPHLILYLLLSLEKMVNLWWVLGGWWLLFGGRLLAKIVSWSVEKITILNRLNKILFAYLLLWKRLSGIYTKQSNDQSIKNGKSVMARRRIVWWLLCSYLFSKWDCLEDNYEKKFIYYCSSFKT